VDLISELLLNNETAVFNKMKYTESYLEFIKLFNKLFTPYGNDIIELSESNIDKGTAIGGATDNKTPLLLSRVNDHLESEDEIEAKDDEELDIILLSLHPLSRLNKLGESSNTSKMSSCKHAQFSFSQLHHT
jgi:hypothetical protein